MVGTGLYFATASSSRLKLPEDIERRPGYSLQLTSDDVNLTGSRIQRSGSQLLFQPRQDLRPWPLQRPVDWNADPFHDRNWRFHLHAWRMMDPLLNQYFKTNDPKPLREAFDYALDWFSYHYERNLDSEMAWYDMAAGIRAMKLGLFVDRYHARALNLSPDEARRLMALVDEHANRLQVDSFISEGNHGLFQVFGLDVLCQISADRQSCVQGREFASEKFSSILKKQFTEEGVHREASPAYHNFVRGTIVDLGGAKRFNSKDAVEILSKAAEVEPWLSDPSGDIVAVGDSAGRSQPLEVPADGSPIVGDFSKSGYAIVRSRNSMLFVMGMAYGYSLGHKHADDLSFVLFEHGRPIFVDSGKYGYNDDSMRRYIESAAAHNTISLLRQDVKPTNLIAPGSELKPIASDGKRFTISGAIERPGLFTQAREIQYIPGQLLVVQDKISSEKEQQFVSGLHLARDLTPRMVDGGFDVVLPEGKTVRARLQDADCKIEEARGQSNPFLGWETVDYLKMEPASVVRAICSGYRRTITWTISLQ